MPSPVRFLLVVLALFCANSFAADCDLSSDELNVCLVGKLKDAEESKKQKVQNLRRYILERFQDSGSSGAIDSKTVLDNSEIAWLELRRENCLVEEASVFDGGARLNVVLQCELKETTLRNARLDDLIELYGGKSRQSRRAARKASSPKP